MKKNMKYGNVIRRALTKDPYTWFVSIEEMQYPDNIEVNYMFYSDDDFEKEGLPIALICNYLRGKLVQEHDWIFDALNDSLPFDDREIHAIIYDVEARNPEGFITFSDIDKSDAKEIITDFLRDELFYDYDQIDTILADLGFNSPVLTPKKPVTQEGE